MKVKDRDISQSLLYHAFGVREGYRYQKTEYIEGRVEFYLQVDEGWLKCPECGRGRPVRRGKPLGMLGFE